MNNRRDVDRKDTIEEFGRVVNMTAADLTTWLGTDKSNSVGQSDGGGESVGHMSGRRIVELLGMKDTELDDEDIAHMRKVVGYVHRHLKQRPSGDISESNWRYSLMNWGHDPKNN